MSDSLSVNPLLASVPLNQQKVGRSSSVFGSASVPQMKQPLSSDRAQFQNKKNDENENKHYLTAMGIAALGVAAVIGIVFLCKGKGKAKIPHDNKSVNAFEASGGFKADSSAKKLYDTDKNFKSFCLNEFAEKLRLREKAGSDSLCHAPAGVSVEDEAIISYYASGGYKKLPENSEQFRTALLKSFANMPNNDKQILFKNITNFDLAEIPEVDGIYQPKEFLSTSVNRNFLGKEKITHFTITNAKGQGKKIARNKGKEEVVFPPNTEFRIRSKKVYKNVTIIEMECMGSAG